MLGFVLGAVAGSVAATYWSRQLRNVRQQRMARLRNQAAARVAIAERAIIGLVKRVSARTQSRLRCEESGRSAGERLVESSEAR
jgi:hypothetical protein